LHLRETGGGNYRIDEHPGIVVKDCFWRQEHSDRAGPVPAREAMSGNAIDFFVDVLGMSFNQAMQHIQKGTDS
jgi:hypothetical protein